MAIQKIKPLYAIPIVVFPIEQFPDAFVQALKCAECEYQDQTFEEHIYNVGNLIDEAAEDESDPMHVHIPILEHLQDYCSEAKTEYFRLNPSN